MTETRREILEAALRLSEADRLIIANGLLDSLPDDVPGLSLDDPALAAELDRRSGEWDNAIPLERISKELGSAR